MNRFDQVVAFLSSSFKCCHDDNTYLLTFGHSFMSTSPTRAILSTWSPPVTFIAYMLTILRIVEEGL